jgi:hypothetical protein
VPLSFHFPGPLGFSFLRSGTHPAWDFPTPQPPIGMDRRGPSQSGCARSYQRVFNPCPFLLLTLSSLSSDLTIKNLLARSPPLRVVALGLHLPTHITKNHMYIFQEKAS